MSAFRMETLTWINKMFLVYFCLDFLFGTIDTYFLFKLFRERYLVASRYLPSHHTFKILAPWPLLILQLSF